MLLNFAVTNYRSIKERQVFSMMAVDGLHHEESLIHSEDGISILPVALLFGANASGKSNILRAFGTMRRMVLNSVRLNPDDALDGYEPFLLDEESRNKNTEFEAEFTIKGEGGIEQLYRYGFAFSGSLITEEWLYRHGESKEIELFSRDGVLVYVNDEAFPEGNYKEGTLASNRLFLSLVAQLNGEKAKEIIDWFKKIPSPTDMYKEKDMSVTLSLLRAREEDMANKYKEYTQLALTFLSNIDVSIKNLSIEEVPITLPDNIPEDFKKLLSALDGHTSPILVSKHNRYNKQEEIIGTEVFSIEEKESEGTKKIARLLGPIFITLSEGRLLVIDELDAKLHPLLTRALIQLFTNPKINQTGAQLIFTTHDTNQLHLDYVRRDEIWFTEKSCVEATELYSHIEFKDFDPSMDITEQYVNGRYGAIPRIKVQR